MLIDIITRKFGGINNKDVVNWQSLIHSMTKSLQTNNIRLDSQFFDIFNVLHKTDFIHESWKAPSKRTFF